MRRLCVYVAFTALVAGACFAGTAAPLGAIGAGRLSVLHVKSADHDLATRDVWVYRPAVPDSRTLPVVYFLHGVPGSAHDFFGAGGKTVLDHMFATGTPPFVLAAPTGTGHAHPDTEWADASDGKDRVESYLLHNVIPAVEGSNRRDARHRIIAGFSMGGFGAANIALRHPDVFSAAASMAGYFHIDDPDAVFGRNAAVERANDPEVLIRTVRSVRFWLGDGTSDGLTVVQGEARRFQRLAGPLVAPGDLVLAPGGHSYGFVLAHLPDVGRFVAHIVSTPLTRAQSRRSAGYSLVGSDGGVFTFPPATFSGSLGGHAIPGAIVAAVGGVVNRSQSGYLLVSNVGRVYPFGLRSFGDLGTRPLNAPISGAAAVPGGYLLVSTDGGVFTFGAASFFGSLAGRRLNAPIVGVASTAAGDGYWLVDSTGRVFPFGNARFLGDLPNGGIGTEVVGIAEQHDGFDPLGVDGYEVATTDGRVFPFGSAVDPGDAGRLTLAAPIRGIASAVNGYYLFASDGGVFAFGEAYDGSTGNRHLNAPMSAFVAQS